MKKINKTLILNLFLLLGLGSSMNAGCCFSKLPQEDSIPTAELATLDIAEEVVTPETSVPTEEIAAPIDMLRSCCIRENLVAELDIQTTFDLSGVNKKFFEIIHCHKGGLLFRIADQAMAQERCPLHYLAATLTNKKLKKLIFFPGSLDILETKLTEPELQTLSEIQPKYFDPETVLSDAEKAVLDKAALEIAKVLLPAKAPQRNFNLLVKLVKLKVIVAPSATSIHSSDSSPMVLSTPASFLTCHEPSSEA